VHRGWSHLQSQRPLAAWASWKRALRVEPDSAVAAQALATLESSADLPLAARTAYRFREPGDPARREAWNDRMRGWDPEDAAAAADLFGRLAVEVPTDPAAWYNRALCLAWMGENHEAIGCLDRATGLDAAEAFDRAVDAWTLAEVLRQGGGAERLADDLRFACTIAWQPGETAWLRDEFPEIQQVPTPRAPGDAPGGRAVMEVFEWLDRPAAALDRDRVHASELPVVLATIFVDRNSLRLSSVRTEALERVEEMLFQRLEGGSRPVRREAAPLPFPFLDADVWTFRIPPGLDPPLVSELQRESVELYFENRWIHGTRRGLDGRSPLAAGRAAGAGDAVARAKLTAVVRMREQLGSRKSARGLYQGYPFDRLRRRLALELVDDRSVDREDVSCAGAEELDRADPSTLDLARLLEAVMSAAGFRDDARTARLAAELLARGAAASRLPELAAAISPLVRQAMSRDDHAGALNWIERARPMADVKTATTFDVWRAEILARTGRPQESLSVYLGLAQPDATGAVLALDAALTMLDNGHLQEAESLLIAARDRARRAGRQSIERRALELLRKL
jgi:hypothetical protein